MKILIAEDEKDLNNIIMQKLNSEGFVTDTCFNGEEALDFLAFSEYDVVLLDIMMPRMDGLTVLRKMRDANNNTPVIFLTAKDTIADKVTGLDMGANDYVVKPFSFEELLARIRAATRKTADSASNRYQLADLVIDTKSHIVTRGGKSIDLSAKEYTLLEYLMRNKGRILSREQIENNVWNFEYEGGTNVVDVYIRYLRVKIDKDFDTKLIHTARGIGYVMREE